MDGLRALDTWLTDQQVTHVAMESTGVYWRPIYAQLEEAFTVLLVNARHVKQVPGRKTDVRDSEWLAQLLECGLLKASFIPPAPIHDLRDLTRYRKVLIRERGHHINRVAKLLELANIKLGSVVTDIMGKTGRAILDALIAGQDDPTYLASLAQGLLKKKMAALQEAVTGKMRPHYAFILQQQLRVIDDLAQRIAAFDAQIERGLRPYTKAYAIVRSAPGIAAPYFPEQARAIQRQASEAMMSAIETELMRQRHKHGERQIEQLFAHTRAFAETYEDVNFTPPYLSRITADTLIVFGDRDPFYPVSIALDLYRAIPRSYLWVVPNGGHGPVFHDAAPPFSETALSFLRGDWRPRVGPPA